MLRAGKKYKYPCFYVYALAKEEGPTRLGLVVSRKVGGAFLRNKYKRIVREFFRRSYVQFPPHLDVVVCMRPQLQNIDSSILRNQLYEFIAADIRS